MLQWQSVFFLSLKWIFQHEGGELTTSDKANTSLLSKWANSDNWLSNMTYNIADGAYSTAQIFTLDFFRNDTYAVNGSNFVHLDGTRKTDIGEVVGDMAATLLPRINSVKSVFGMKAINTFNKLNAAQFSKTFKGNLSKLSASTRGQINRTINKGIERINGVLNTPVYWRKGTRSNKIFKQRK